MAERKRTRKFRAETRKLLDLMIHSVYAQREVFLRELISNASDAIDKARFLALTDESLSVPDDGWEIRLIPDADAGTLTVRDNGIGMSEDEVIENIGTIARSGSEAFLAAMEGGADGADSDLIGRFGVGFYSAFMAAEKVELTTTKHGEDHGVYWASEGGDTYTIRTLDERTRGTEIVLHLKPWARGEESAETQERGSPPMDFTSPEMLRMVVKQHSNYVAYPIILEHPAAEDGDGAPKTETLNTQRPLWTRDRDEITAQEHAEFYRHIAHDWQDPLAHVHIKAEGLQQYIGLLYIPAKAPMDIFTREARRGLQLYSRRVLIMEECDELMPEYLRFVRGVVDSPDIPLSLSREAVQQDRLIGSIRRHLTKKVMEELDDLQENERERYEQFWAELGPVLKEGFHLDPTQHERLRGLLLMRTTHDDGWTTLDEYVSRMKDGQDAIYWLVGDRLELLRSAPQLEAFRARGVEVLLLTEPADEIVMSMLQEHADYPLKSVAGEKVDLSKLETVATPDGASKAGDDADATPTNDALKPFLERLSEALGDDIEEVRASDRLVESAACLVATEGSVSPQLERLMKAMGQEIPRQKRVLEINPSHPLIRKMLRIYLANAADPRIVDYGGMLYDQALLAEGTPPRDPAAFARRVADVMARATETGATG